MEAFRRNSRDGEEEEGASALPNRTPVPSHSSALPHLQQVPHFSFPTPPYTPAAHNNADEHPYPMYVSYEENNNMDENSNDQEYEQYSQYHEQHFRSQQNQLLNEQQTNRSSDFERLNTFENTSSTNQDSYSRSNGEVPSQHSLFNNTHSNESTSSPSVRPRTNLPNSRRMSLTPQSSFSRDHSRLSPHQQHTSQNRRSSLYHSEASSSPNRASGADDGDSRTSLPTLPRHRGHHRNSSYDSGMAELHNQRYLQAEFGQGGRQPEQRPIETIGHLSRRQGSRTETEHQAEMLLYHFTQEELSREQLSLPTDLTLPQSLLEMNMLRTGSDLRKLADAFAATPERKKVRSMAEKVSFSEISWENFASLCMELFSGWRGITKERIVALFLFISDVAKQQIKRGAEAWLRTLMEWSLRFMVEKICSWVQESGGWGRVLQQGLDIAYKTAVIVVSLAGTAALGVYIFKTMRHG